MVWKIFLFLLMAGVIIAAFIFPAPQQQIGDASRIFYFHVPQAWVGVVAFVVSLIASIRYLRKGKIIDDDRARVAAGLGLLFTILATVSGSIYAKATWGAYWNWDPRQTSILMLLLIYGAYFALRSAIEVETKRARLSAVYAIFAFITVPFLVFIIPRMMLSLHPSDTVISSSGSPLGTSYAAAIFFSSLIAFTGLFFWINNLALRICIVERRMLEESDQ